MSESPITTHVLDLRNGRPAAGVNVRLEQRHEDVWRILARGTTNEDGRLGGLLPAGSLEAGEFRLTFEIGDYFAAASEPTFYPEVNVTFQVVHPGEHHHVPLLLSPFGYSTYRGS